MNTKESNKITTSFKQQLLDKIKKTKEMQKRSQQFQDLHWDDVYSVYYDSGSK